MILRYSLFISILLTLVACNNSREEKSSIADTVSYVRSHSTGADSTYEVMYDTFRAKLNDARFSDTVFIFKLVSFSDPTTKDTFAFKIQPGMVANSGTLFYIKNAAGKLLFSDSFNTDWMVYDMISEVIPHSNMTREEREGMIVKICQMDNNYIQNYIRDAANNILTEVLTDRKTVLESSYMLEKDVIEDSVALKRYIHDTSLKVIFIPGFHWEEGGCIYTYLPEDASVHEISCFD